MKTIRDLQLNEIHAFLLQQMEAVKSPALKYAIREALDSAANNAADTCYEDGLTNAALDVYAQRWHTVFLATLEGVTTWRETPAAARKWFANRGVVG